MKDCRLTVAFLVLVALCIAGRLPGSNQEAVAPQAIDEFSPSVITESGHYKLSTDAVGTITISASCVTFDLNGYCIANGTTHGIVINNNASQVIVRNGVISSPISGNGIEIASGCDGVTVRNIRTAQCAIGLNVSSSNGIIVENSSFIGSANEGVKLTSCSRCSISGCKSLQNATGFSFDQCTDNNIYDCLAVNNSFAGYSLATASRNLFLGCKSLQIGSGSATDSYGFITEDGTCNSFDCCRTEGTVTTATAITNVAIGFALKGAESCSSIISSSVCGTQTPSGGSSAAYGVRLEESLSALGVLAFNTLGATAYTCQWHPKICGFCTVAGAPTNNQIRSYLFDQKNNTLQALQGLSHGSGGIIYSLDWSDDGNYLACSGTSGSGGYDLRVYRLDLCTKLLSVVNGLNYGSVTIQAISWSPDGNYLVGAAQLFGFLNFLVRFSFNKTTGTLALLGTQNPGATVQVVEFAPNDWVVAVGSTTTGGNQLFIYEFDLLTEALTLRDSQAHGATVRGAAWSWDGRYLAVVGDSGTGGFDTRVYEFDSSTKTLTLRDSQAHGATVYGIDWSSCGRYVVTGGATSGGNNIRVYSFDRSTKTLSLAASQVGASPTRSASWSVAGNDILVAGDVTSGATHGVFSALTFPSNNTIMQNKISCVAGNSIGTSVGLSGSNCSNLIKNNHVYGNDRNYCFVSNVVDGCALCTYAS